MSHDPLVVLDGAHNPDGAAALAATLGEGFDPAGGTLLVVGALDGRDPRALLSALRVDEAATVITCTPPSPRGLSASDLAVVVGAMGGRPDPIDDVAEAVRTALEAAGRDDLVLITGSLYTVGAARAALRELGIL